MSHPLGPVPDRPLTSTQFGAQVGVAPKTVLRWREEGRITAASRTLGGDTGRGRWLFSPQELQRVQREMGYPPEPDP